MTGRTPFAGLLAAALVIASISSPATAYASAPRNCVPVQLTAIGQDQGPSNGVIHTVADVFLGRLKVAATAASFTPTGPPAGSVLSFAGPIVISPVVGDSTLTATVNGSVDLSTGMFTATSTRVTGTRHLSGVTGELTFAGTENSATGAFTETITGVLCG